MVEDFTEELYVDNGRVRKRLVGRPPFELALQIGERFRFQICRKDIRLGETGIHQWWMPHGSVYPDRKRQAANFRPIVGYWWALCQRHLTILHEDVQESYILARILPFARSNGSRKVFADAVPTRAKRLQASPQDIAEELEQRLRGSGDQEMGIAEFRDRTADALGRGISR